MPMLKDPSKKYKPAPRVQIENRQWPSKTLDKPPRWLSTDLRDGNQSLVDPMDGEQKWKYFKMLVELGYKEIEVSFPSASQTDFDFTRRLVETPGATPDDVWLQVLSPCREELIKRTVDSLKGAKKAILHIYLATSECFQRIVFGLTEEEGIALAVKCTKYARSITKDDPSQAGTEWGFEFSPECFSDSRPEFVIQICEAVKEAWGPSVENPIIFNLPATVEISTPNVYADQIEWFCTHISEREKICVSLHPHNDRGCAVAAAELAQMAGADRVEGCLFGNGERTGNVDLVTLGLNLYTQGIHPGIDFSDLEKVIDVVEVSNKIPVHPRWPYGGSLVVCAFSGSHQDAIKKGFQLRKKEGATDETHWQMPYLPLDPADIGRTYEAIIRVNSQSGKGGAAWIILRNLELDLPRGLQVAFSKVVQHRADQVGRELLSNEITDLFEQTYFLKENPRFTLIDYSISTDRSTTPVPAEAGKTQDTKNLKRTFEGVILFEGREIKLRGTGNGPISSLANALSSVGIDLDVADYKEHAIGGGRDVKAASYIECTAAGSPQKVWGVGVHEDVVQSSLIALLSAASNFVASRPNTPMLLKGLNHARNVSQDIHLNDKESNGLAIPKPNGAPQSGPDAVSVLEAKVKDL
ncbi:2-isopropylmalate synthase [Coleophoma cylindrospora]|uniref:2-isopropylmalate synthase n=1 Tax=Coleophoma cylindrospora TaxID=1849047 RepID=A0A3D8S1M2_9HELO|nr:2-isopropylmalate synthase [Coleophoma cylindrospora]